MKRKEKPISFGILFPWFPDIYFIENQYLWYRDGFIKNESITTVLLDEHFTAARSHKFNGDMK
ncbi:MAG: hypothetical protein QXO15_01715 [Nitrososphaerota archaeon]